MYRIGAVSYLNSIPLIAGLDSEAMIDLAVDVPSRLLDNLIAGRSTIALCPVIDFQRAPETLEIVPVGAIGCFGPTMTVRLFSTIPFDQVDTVHVDKDSHTSIALLQVIFNELYGRIPRLIHSSFDAGDTNGREAILLIGDKVITSESETRCFPHQLDLGEAWRQVSGLPFVFATWMTLAGTELGPIPELLAVRLEHNRKNIEELVRERAEQHGWPLELAREYLGQRIRYDVGAPQIEAITLFWKHCHEIGILDKLKALRIHPSAGVSGLQR